MLTTYTCRGGTSCFSGLRTYNKAQVIRADKRRVPQSRQRGVYTLSRLLVCPHCHQTLSFCMKYNKRKYRNTLDKSGRELYILNLLCLKKDKRLRPEHNAVRYYLDVKIME